ncbi:hypothetical protein LINPERPRIM_LOCUS8694 [Linum perenne]
MKHSKHIHIFFLLLITTFHYLPHPTTSKSTIEPSFLFQIDPISLLTANSIDISYSDVENQILPSQLFLKVPIHCSSVDGIRKSVSTHYKTRPSDT